ncbi:WD repeat-containing protein 31-like [Clavelina lepadiformis]|uniref:WD repeat-containing protein 31-like n=1 Tax=Clavelina lepadiformis TaxID=159417 RepID=UPI0040421E48
MMGKWISKQRRYSDTTDRIRSKKVDVGNQKSNSLDYGMARKQAEDKWIGMFSVKSCHSDAVTSLCTSSSNFCISGSKDKTVVLQDVLNGVVLQKWKDHTQEVTKVRCSGNLVASTSRDLSVKIWKTDSQESEATLEGHKLVVTAVDFSADNQNVVTGSRDNFVKVWDVETEEVISEQSISRNLVTDVRWMKGENLIVQTSEDKMLKLWDPRTVEVVHSFPLQNQIQTCCDINGLYCLTGCNGFNGQGCQIHLWDIRQRAKLQEYRGHTETVSGCSFNEHTPGSHTFASCSHDGTVRFWQEHKQKHVSCEQLNVGTLTSIAALNKDTLLCGGFERGISLLRIGNCGQLVSSCE